MAASDENTPLLANGHANVTTGDSAAARDGQPAPLINKASSESRLPRRWQRVLTPELSLLIAGFLITTALCFTQVPILYAFRKMECEEFYKHAPPYEGVGDRCNEYQIDSGTALQMMILGLSNIVCGVINLFLTGMYIRRRGPHFALMLNTFFPILRVTMQAIGVGVGFRTGIVLVQVSQVMAIVGGPAGYLLVLNTAIAEVVEPSQRTGAFGKLQGAAMFGTAVGYLQGGIVGEMTAIIRPFEITAGLLALSCIYCFFCTPYIDPKTLGAGDQKKPSSVKKGKSPFAVLGPQMRRLRDGSLVKFYSVPILALGVFVAVLAVGYGPILTQMYALTVLNFAPKENSFFMFLTASVRGLFLMFAFPRIITWGRKWQAPKKDAKQPDPVLVESIPTEPQDMDPVSALPEQEPVNPPKPVDEDAGAAFDLWFLRVSMLGDALLTGCIGFASQSWHIYLAGFLLPLFSGSDAASKGVFTEMVPPAQRPEVLQAISLVGSIAALSTVGIFGLVFSAFAAVGKANLSFFVIAAVAVFAIIILLFVKIPPQGSVVESDDEEAEVQE
ncbi:hypothetical protein JX266_007963 [Neoarthrinium moseri]|nr:hypothetical protein JX266_007963 [Neoarthrinium moseri]